MFPYRPDYILRFPVHALRLALAYIIVVTPDLTWLDVFRSGGSSNSRGFTSADAYLTEIKVVKVVESEVKKALCNVND